MHQPVRISRRGVKDMNLTKRAGEISRRRFRWPLRLRAGSVVLGLVVLALWVALASCKSGDKDSEQSAQVAPTDNTVGLRNLKWSETLDRARMELGLPPGGRLTPRVFTWAAAGMAERITSRERAFWNTVFGGVSSVASSVVDTFRLRGELERVRLLLLYDEDGRLIRGCYVAGGSMDVQLLEKADEEARGDRPLSEFTIVEQVQFPSTSDEVVPDAGKGVGLCLTDKRAMERPPPQGGFRNVVWGISPETLRMRLDASYQATATGFDSGSIDDLDSMVNWVLWKKLLGDDPEFPPLQFDPTWDTFRGRLGPSGGHIAIIEGSSVPFVVFYDPSKKFARACYVMSRSYPELLEGKYGRGQRQSERTYWKTDDTVVEAAGSYGVPHTLCYTSVKYLQRMAQREKEKQRVMSEGL